MTNNKQITELDFVEIGIIRAALEKAFYTGHITGETQQACENLISKIQHLDAVFHFTDDTHYTWREF